MSNPDTKITLSSRISSPKPQNYLDKLIKVKTDPQKVAERKSLVQTNKILPPSQWVSLRDISKSIGSSNQTAIFRLMKNFDPAYSLKSEWYYHQKGKCPCLYFDSKFAQDFITDYNLIPPAPKGWQTTSQITRQQKSSDGLVQKLYQKFIQQSAQKDKSQFSHTYRDKRNQPREFYCPEAVSYIKHQLQLHQAPPTGWKTLRCFAYIHFAPIITI